MEKICPKCKIKGNAKFCNICGSEMQPLGMSVIEQGTATKKTAIPEGQKKEMIKKIKNSIEEPPRVITVLMVLGWMILVVGIVGSIFLGNSLGSYAYYGYGVSSFNVAVFLVGVFSSVVSCAVFLGLSEMIKYQYKNYRETKIVQAFIEAGIYK